MNGVLPRATTGSPALRAALVSMVMITFTFCWKMSELKAFTAPSAPLPSSATSSSTLRAQDAALGVDLGRGKLGRLHHRGRDDASSRRDRPTGMPILTGGSAVRPAEVTASKATMANADRLSIRVILGPHPFGVVARDVCKRRANT